MDQSQVLYEFLGRVTDPEIPVLTLHDMGILRGVDTVGWAHPKAQEALEKFKGLHSAEPLHPIEFVYRITISPTYVGCPAMDRMAQDIEEALYVKQVPFFIETQLNPAWTTDWITPEGLAKMADYGIAPPVKGSADKRALFAESPRVPCPRCKSTATTMISAHGSTACKSLYKCTDCLEPFEYFKCL
jgi:ring-1,2-phenylacetyl-CoA epoxidase subunit PaaD